LEYGYEEAGAVSFDKGCYIGQELITRTKRVGEVRKALYCLHLEGKQKPIDALSSFGDYALILGYKQDFEGKDIIEINGIKYKVLC
jgi:folate-binding Fe-S cluster repair protein YgfZ